eukprot:CAMPEP_0178910914 /NCGR_PEP_ID=MMETSP0786-20121207/9372_1 /TAXON_ID=186022 /ORGANISM="Thalassionema frauenfeldii, Strain CCMP 1798" /LENGTH=455 /DNA_ID=CAMNT_0020583239 /DNA_START=37 /DNA_END=1401 /DNA_ORIENTATION=+
MHRRNQRPANPFSEGGRRLTYSNDPRYGQQTTRFERRSSGHIVPIFCFGILLLSSTFSWTSTPSPPPRLLDDAAKHPVKGFTSKQYLDLGYKARLRDNEEEKLPYHKPEEEKKEGSGDEHSNEHPKLAQKDSHDEDEDFLNENFHAMEENGDGIHEQIDERFSQDHKLNNTGSAEMDGQHHDPVIGEDFHVSVKTGEESKEFLLGSTNGEDNKNLEKSDFAAQSVLKTLESSKENETSPELENESTANLAKVESRNISTVDIATQNGFVSNAITNKTLGNASIAIPEFDDEKKSGYDASRNSYNDTDALTTFNNESEINESKNASVAFPETVEGLTNHSMESNETIIDTTEAVKSNSSGVADVEKTHSEKGSSGESNETLVAKGIVDYDNGEDLETPKLPDEDDEEDHEIELSREVVGNANITISESDNEEKNDYEASKNSYNKTDALNASDNET